MHRTAIACAVSGALLASCASAPSRPSVPETRSQFTASSLGTQYGIQGSFGGTVVRRGEWLYVTVPTGAVRTFQRDRQEHWDLRLRAAVAACTGPRQWEIVSESRAVRVAPLLGLTQDGAYLDTTLLRFKDTARVDVGIPPGVSLRRSWLALIVEWPIQNGLATYPLHSNMMLDGSEARSGSVSMVGPARCAE